MIGRNASHEGFAVPTDASANPRPAKIRRRQAKKPNQHPPFLFRLKTDPSFCFLQLTTIFNRTTIRLKRIKFEASRSPSASAAHTKNPKPGGEKAPPRALQKCFGFKQRQSFVFRNLQRILSEPMFRVEIPRSERK